MQLSELNMIIKQMRYTKDSGEVSERKVIVITRPRDNYLMYDVSNLSDDQLATLKLTLEEIDKFRDNAMADFELVTGVKQNSLWRSFKPGGVEWIESND